MNQKLTKVLALALAASMALTACGSTTDKQESSTSNENTASTPSTETTTTTPAESTPAESEVKPLTDLVLAKTADISALNPIYGSTVVDGEVTSNLFDGLLECTNKGELRPGIATSWSSNDDATVWTFELRDDVNWVDYEGNIMAPCTAHDFATYIEYTLNFHKSGGGSSLISQIKGAQDYYDYTSSLSKEEAYALTSGEGSKFREMVGVATDGDYTLIFTSAAPATYFPSIGLTNGLMPFPQTLIDQLGIEGFNAVTYDQMWYNGPYTLTHWVQNNEKVFTRNPEYWDKDCTLFDTITFLIVESNDVAYQMYQNGEVDYVSLTESTMKAIKDNENHEFHDYLVEDLVTRFAYSWHWNFNKNLEDGTPDENWNKAVANEAFRMAFYYGLDLKDYYSRYNSVSPMSLENLTFTQQNMVYTPDGTDYAVLVRERLGLKAQDMETQTRLDADKFAALKAQAMEELSAIGVTFPVSVVTYCAGSNQTEIDSLTILKDAMAKSLGDDFVQLEIKTFVSSRQDEVLTPRLQSFMINGWGADFADPCNFHEAVAFDGTGWYSKNFTNIATVEANEYTQALVDTYAEYDAMCKAASELTDLQARYEAYADAEAYQISHGLLMPCRYDMTWCLTKVNVHSKMYAMYGSAAQKIKNWETNANGYTTAEMEAIKAAK